MSSNLIMKDHACKAWIKEPVDEGADMRGEKRHEEYSTIVKWSVVGMLVTLALAMLTKIIEKLI